MIDFKNGKLFEYELETRSLHIRLDDLEAAIRLTNRLGIDLVDYQSEWTITEGVKRCDSRGFKQKEYALPMGIYAGPRFHQPAKHAKFHLILNTDKSDDELSRILEQKITDKTKATWYPKKDFSQGKTAWVTPKRYDHDPIYIISKGRASCYTAKTLRNIGADFKIVVEPQEVKTYQSAGWGERVITGDFDTTTKSSIPVRNYVDDISPSDTYWLMDDNISNFWYLTDNIRRKVATNAIFHVAESLFKSITNLGQAGFNYSGFANAFAAVPPYYKNTRIYSCTWMKRNVKNVRVAGKLWRGRYNEDTDLSLRILKAGYTTMLLNVFLPDKCATMRMKGGNTDSVYVDGDKRYKFAKSLMDQHPDVTRIVERYGRYHHQVDYSGFRTDYKQDKPYIPIDYQFELKEDGKSW